MIGQGDLWQRLGGSLVASPAKLVAAGWRPAVDTREGLVTMMHSAKSVHGRQGGAGREPGAGRTVNPNFARGKT
jgi:hypothetical protein